jgi:hypothetical protein
MSEYQQVVKEGRQKIGKIFKRFMVGLLILGLLSATGFFLVSNYTYSKGARAGTLIKLSKKGVMFKTYEGQLNLGGFKTEAAEGISGNIWEFSVWKDDIYQELQNYEGHQVKLHYREIIRPMPWQGKTKYFVYKAEPVKKLNQAQE